MKARRQRLGVALSFIAVVSLLLSYRLHRPAEWLVSAPRQVGVWEAVETPLSGNVREQLGDPKTSSLEYRNPLDERLTCQLIAPRSFEAYREPYPLNMMSITAQRQIMLFGPGKPVRAWVLKNNRNGVRILVYAWLQYPKGETRIFGAGGMHQGNWDRFLLGWQQLTDSESPCLVRLISIIPAMDTHANQTRRSMEEVARALYATPTTKGVGG